jgi:hypothetical protein
MKKLSFLTAILFVAISVNAQKYLTREGYIKFYGKTPLENIEAVSNQASSVIDASTNKIVFQVLANSFTFEKALMQEHFNENYVESGKFPNASFVGVIVEKVNFNKPGSFDVTLKGTMSLHGVNRMITVPAKLIVEKGSLKISSEFALIPEVYDIDIPGAVRDKIAKQMEVKVKCSYKLVK